MLLYEVNLSIESEIYAEYKSWLTSHIKEMLNINGFISATLWEESEEQKTKVSIKKLVVTYKVDSQKKLEQYFNNQAHNMRKDGLNRFGNRFGATRRILRLQNEFHAK